MRLQWLDARGYLKGPPVALGVQPAFSDKGSVASDGVRILGCAQGADCAAITLQGQAVTGSLPYRQAAAPGAVLTFNQGVWLLGFVQGASVGQGPIMKLQRLNADATALGTEVTLPEGYGRALDYSRVAIAPHGAGFVAAGGDPVHVYRLSLNLEIVGVLADLGVHPWYSHSIGASASTIVVSVSRPYGGHLFILDTNGEIDGAWATKEVSWTDLRSGKKRGVEGEVVAGPGGVVAALGQGSYFATVGQASDLKMTREPLDRTRVLPLGDAFVLIGSTLTDSAAGVSWEIRAGH